MNLASRLNLAANLMSGFLNFEFDAISRKMALKGAKMAPNSKFKNSVNKKLPNLVENLISKFQVKILKNVGVAILVTEIEQQDI